MTTTAAHCAACGNTGATGSAMPEPPMRPRFFAGQSLTEAELNSAQAYQLAKNRLHNRYLHGVGVVCGLQLACVADRGSVRLHPGYALDPCGNDLVLTAARALSLTSMIAACRDAEDQACAQPWRPAPVAGDEPERWCLTMAYLEQPTRARTVLTTGRAGKSCGCGCQGAVKMACGCGSTATPQKTVPPYDQSVPAGCEPTRIAEGVRFDVCRAPDGPCQDAFCDPQATLAGRIVAAFGEYRRILRGHLSPAEGDVLLRAGFSAETPFEPGLIHAAYRHLRDAILDLERRQPFPVTGDPSLALDAVVLDPPGGDPDQYRQKARVVLQRLEAALVQSFTDRVAGLLLPPCPPEPCTDRIVLGCVTVAAGKIVRICTACRTDAGAFPAQGYRLSVLPVAALYRAFTEFVTCRDWVTATGNPLFDLAAGLDPNFRRGRWQAGGYSPVPQLAELIRRLCNALAGERDEDTLGMLRGWLQEVTDDGAER
jgi:hypothetical protein